MKTRHMPIVLALTLAAASAAPAAEPGYRLLHGLNSLDGATLTWGTNVNQKNLALSTDAAHRSEGAASLHLSGVPNKGATRPYLGAKVAIPKTDFTDRRLRFDAWTATPQATNALYVRLYNAKGKCVASWSNWSSPFRAQSHRRIALRDRVSRRRFRYEPNVATGGPPTDVVAIEFIIGTRSSGAPFDLFIDNICVSKQTVQSALALKKPKKLYLRTTLVQDGKPAAVIVSPPGAGYMAAAKRIQAALGLPIKNAMSAADMAKTTAVLLGDVNSNRSLAPLYALCYVAADAVYPGAGGWVVRTVHDPWGTGKNAVVLAGPGPAEVSRAVDQLLKLVRDPRNVTLPRLLKVKFGADPTGSLAAYKQAPRKDYVEQRMKSARRALAQGRHGGITDYVAQAGARYGLTGHEAYAQAFKKLVFLMYEHYLSRPKTYGGPWGMDSDFRLYRMMPALDLAEESPSLTAADRLKITNIYAEFISTDSARKAQGVLGSKRVRYNHQTFPALGLLYAGLYYKKYYDADEASFWLDIADECFRVQMQGAKAHEDCNGYQWLTNDHTMRYALGRPDFTWFRNNNAQRIADYCLLCMDNLGYQVPYGDTGPWQCWWTEMPYLRAAAWFTHDPRYYFALAKKAPARPRIPMFEYANTGPAIEPVDLLGTRAWPLDARWYQTFRTPDQPPRAAAVDKVVMRASFDPDKQYLLLDGLSTGGHKHYDGNSISRITDRGRIWLADNDYIKALPKFHNGVLVLRDGESSQIPAYCELEHVADFDSTGFSTTTARNYGGANWRRNIIWAKERYFLVIDEMEATEDNEFSFRALWHTVGEVEVGPKGLAVEQKGVRFFIRQAPGPRLRLRDDEALGRNWAGYPYAKPVVRVFEQIADATLKKGERYRFFNLLYGSDDQRPQRYDVRRVADGCVALAGDQTALAGVAGLALGDDMRTDAALFLLTQDAYALVHATQLVWREPVLRSDRPILADARAGAVELTAGEPTRIELFAVAPDARVTGQCARVERRGQRLILHGVSGRCRVGGVRTTLAGFGEVAAGLPVAAPAAAAARASVRAHESQPLKLLWTYKEKLAAYLLTHNAGRFEAVDTGCAITSDPAPRATNVFSGEPQRLDALTDGALRSTQAGVMWPTDQPVTLTLDLKQPYEIKRIHIKAWWADRSSKHKIYQLARATFEASCDGFRRDVRRLGEIVDTKTHGNWGAPGYAPEDYKMKVKSAQARYVRMRLKPRPGAGIYLAEVEIWGDREGLAIDLAAKRKRGIPTPTFVSLCAADVDGDGNAEILAGSNLGKAYLIASDGTKRWERDMGERVDAITAAKFAPGAWAVVAGTRGARVGAWSPKGEKLWVFDIPAYKGVASVRTLFPADLNGDGRQEVVAGARSWRYYAFNATGKQLWQYESVHDATAGAAADLDRDGKDEVLAGTNYYWWSCIRGDGSRAWGYSSRTGPTANAVAAGDIAGDDKWEAIFGGADGYLHVLSANGKLLWKRNVGDEVTGVAAADLDHDGKAEVIASSLSFSVYAFRGDGKRVWRTDLGEAVAAMAVLRVKGGQPLIAAGTDTGRVVVLDAAGKIVRESSAAMPPSSVLKIVAADLDGDGVDEIVVSGEDGSLRALR